MIARADALASLAAEEFDVAVIGGGITGAGVALDAASRGYTVALLEQADYASGTSSRSSKLVHGGLRYLRSFDLGLVREALLERSLMVRLAPHLVRPLPLLVPFFDGRRRDAGTGMGLNLYDVMASERLRRRGRLRAPGRGGLEEPVPEELWSPDRHRVIDGDEAVELLPALRDRPPSSAFLFYDCQTDDARLVLSVLAEAERFGAVCANRCEAVALFEDDGRPAGVRALDRVSGEEFVLRAARVVNATGVWADRLRPDELEAEAEVPRIRPSRGVHVTLSAERIPLRAGAIVTAGDGRGTFALPWLGRTLLGTTDRDYEGPLDHVEPDPEAVDYLLDAAGEFFGIALRRDEVTGAYAGVRPLISGADNKKSVDISRRAELFETSSGLITITGGKLTTWRRMAKLAVDRLVERDGAQAECRTHEIPLGEPVDPDALADVPGVGEQARVALAARYGHAAHDVLALAAGEPTLAKTLVDGLPDLAAEAAYAARREQATTLGDVLLRRTRLGLLDARASSSDAVGERVGEAMAPALGWDAQRIRRELEDWRAEARAEGIVGPGPLVLAEAS